MECSIYISMFGLSQKFSDVSSLHISVDVQLLHENGKWILGSSNGLNCWAFVYKPSGCKIDSCCSYLNFRYHTCFEKRAPLHWRNCRVYIHSKTCMWHEKSTQLYSYQSTLFYKSLSFTAELRHLTFSMVEQLQLRQAGIGFILFHTYLLF